MGVSRSAGTPASPAAPPRGPSQPLSLRLPSKAPIDQTLPHRGLQDRGLSSLTPTFHSFPCLPSGHPPVQDGEPSLGCPSSLSFPGSEGGLELEVLRGDGQLTSGESLP